MSQHKYTVGDKIAFQPRNGGTFPTGESKRFATIEEITESEYVVRQEEDGFTRRIKESQIM